MSIVKSNKFSPQSLPIVEIDGFNESESFVVGTGQTTFTSQKFTDRTPVRAFIRNDVDPQIWDELTVNFITTTDFEIVEGVSDGDDFILYGITGYIQSNNAVDSDDVVNNSTNTLFDTSTTLTQVIDNFGASSLLESYKDYGIGTTTPELISEAQAEDVNLESGLYILDNITDASQGLLLTINYQGTIKQNYYPFGQDTIFTRDNDGGSFSAFVEISGSGGGETVKPTTDLGASYTLSATDLGAILYSTQASTLTIPDVPTTTIDNGFFCEVQELVGQIDIVAETSSQLVSLEGQAVKSIGAGSNIQIKRVTDTQWVVSGDIAQLINEGWNLSTASYDSVSFSVTSQETAPSTISFKPDGTKMYIVGNSTDSVFQYTLSTPWDISTASYDSVSFSVASEESTPTSMFFKSDGTKMYMVGAGTDNIYQYTLSTAWDVSTTSYDSVSFNINAQDSSPTSIFFKSDGTKMYMVGLDDNVFQYTLSTAWDLSTASYDSVSFSVAGQDDTPRGLSFKDDGSKMYIIGHTNDSVYQYTLSTAWDVSTTSYDSVSFNIASEEPDSRGMFFKDDGTKMYIVGLNSTVYQYTLTS